MSNSATESGQESGGSNGNQGQESGAGGQSGQESGGQGNGGTGNGGNGSGDSFDLSTIQDPALRSYLEAQQKDAREARAEAARYRTDLRTTQDQFTQFRTQHETAEQAAERERQAQAAQEKERLTSLERENRDLKVGGVLRDAALTAKAINPATVVGLLKDKVTLDEQGQPTNLQDLITGLKSTDPYLFKRASSDAGRGNGQGEGSANVSTDMNDRIRTALRGGGA